MLPPTFQQLNRRQWLKAAAAGCATLATGAHAIEPIVRTGQPHLKLSLAAYSFNRQLARRPAKPEPGRMTLADFIDFCAEQNLDGTELTSYYFPRMVNRDVLNELKEHTFRLGLDISGTAISNDFCVPEGPVREEQLALTREWVDHAADLGTGVIRIFAGNVPAGDTAEKALERCVSAIDEAAAYAGTRGVVLALENHGGITATADQLLAIVERVKPTPWFGVNFDSGNFRSSDPYADLERIAPYAVNAQVKVSVFKPEGGKAKADLPRIIQILKESGYRGYVALEYEEPEDPRENIPGYLKQLRELIS